jgi:predicted MFS family arabinose efflux permease
MHKKPKEKLFTPKEKSILISLSAALGLRQLGLLLVLPFLSTWGVGLEKATPALIGLAMGIFGLTQGLLLIPYGLWSDRIGRKTPFIAGMLIFTFGLVLASFSTSIYMLIIARALQGGGAVASVIFSWIGDAILAEKRNRAMALPAIAIGISSTLAFIGGPVLIPFITVEQMFLLCAMFSAAAVAYIIFFIPPGAKPEPVPFNVREYLAAMKSPGLLPLYLSGTIMNYVLVAVFYILPQLITRHMTREDTWLFLVPAVIAGMAVMRPATKAADAGKTKTLLLGSYCLVALAGLLFLADTVPAIFVASLVFFVSYMIQTTLVPATITNMVGAEARGTVTGTYNALTNVGSFLGGALTGVLWGISPPLAATAIIFVSLAGSVMLWAGFKGTMTQMSIPRL